MGMGQWTWPVDGGARSTALVAIAQGERMMGEEGQGLAQGQGLAPGQQQALAPVLMQALRALSCLIGDGFDLKLQSSHSYPMNHTSSTFALSGGFVGGTTQGGGLLDGPFISLCAMLAKVSSLYPQDDEVQLVLLPMLLVVLTSSLPCKVHCLDHGVLSLHLTRLLESGGFRSPLHIQAQHCLAQLALSPSEQAVVPLTTHPLNEGDTLQACLRVMELAELYEERRPLGESRNTLSMYPINTHDQYTLSIHPIKPSDCSILKSHLDSSSPTL